MKIKIFTLTVLYTLGNLYANSQTPGVTDIGVGYFNDHQFATFGTISGTPPTLTGSLAGNAFTINFSNNSRSVLQTIAGYGPNLPTNSGTFSTAFVEINYSSVPATSTVTFTNTLQPLDQFHAVDIENGEGVTFEFLDATSTPVTIANNIKIVSLSTITPTASLNYPSTTMVGINTTPNRLLTPTSDQGFSFIMLTNVVKTIRFIQTNASTGGSWDFTLSRGTADRGDAPSTYGNATHLSLAARLKLGTRGGDAEQNAFSGSIAAGDNAVSGSTIVNDEDGISSVPTVTNSGAQGQVIASYAVTTTVTNSTGSNANVVAWADWNGDGVFGASEGLVGSVVPTGSSNVSRTFTWNNVAITGPGGMAGTFLRVRTTTGALTTSNASGFSTDGEVEDYFIPYAVVLPVTFRSFSVSLINNHYALLEWKTENEQNNTGFAIEHSADGTNWKEIGFVSTKAAAGNNSGTLEYSFTHYALVSGRNYYRLKQIDIDGKISYGSIRSLDINGDGITIGPNPASDAVIIKGVQEDDLIILYNSSGQSLIKQKANTQQVHLDVSSFPKGLYTIFVKSKFGVTQSFKIFKQ